MSLRAAAGLALLAAALGAAPLRAETALPAELAAWVAAHPAVRFGPEARYGPFVYADEGGAVRGLSVEMLRLVQRHTGLAVDTLPPRPLQELLAAAGRRELDMLSSLRPTPERAEYLLFTAPYVEVPAVVMVPAGRAGGGGLGAMDGWRVAVGQGYAVEAVVRARHPAVRWQAVPDDAQALRGVAERRFDAAVVDAASAAFVMRQERLAGLVSDGPVGFNYALSFAVRKDWPQLRDVLDHGIRAIDGAERNALMQRWLSVADADAVDSRPAPRATRLGLALLVASAMVALAVAWRRRARGGR